jgi:peptidoglycan hydrolase-like protein with peptidoglycan-binding domain
MIHIHLAIGRGGANDRADEIEILQWLLNQAGALTTLNRPLLVDGSIGPITIRAIEDFQRRNGIVADGWVQPGGRTLARLEEVAAEFSLVVATVYGEAATSSEIAWKSILWVMKNRVGAREWSRYASLSEIIRHTGFDACALGNAPFRKAEAYMRRRSAPQVHAHIERVVRALLPVYYDEEEDCTSNATMYFSPRAQAKLHATLPRTYRASTPTWAVAPTVKEVRVPGLQAADDFRFVAYK